MSVTGGNGKNHSDAALGESAVVVVEDFEAEGGSTAGRRNPLFVLPLLLGGLLLVLDIVIFTRLNSIFAPKAAANGIALSLLAASAAISVFLIAYALTARRVESAAMPQTDGSPAASAYMRLVVVPLIVGLLGLLATVWAVQGYLSTSQRTAQKSCIDLYEQAQRIAKDNPQFRMLATDRDEVRCAINKALGR